MPERQDGKIKSIKADGHFGFLRDPSEAFDRFFAGSECEFDLDQVTKGDWVTFTPQDHEKGPRAVDLTLSDGMPETAHPQRKVGAGWR